MVTFVEGTEFVMDRIYPGALINANNFLMEEELQVTLRCRDNSILLAMDRDTYQSLLENHSSLQRDSLLF